MKEITYKVSGDRTLLISVGNEISEQVNRKAVQLAERINTANVNGIVEAVPAYCDVTVKYDPIKIRPWKVKRLAERQFFQINDAPDRPKRVVEIPVVFGGSHGQDLAYIAEYHHLTQSEVVRIFTSVDYRVYMIGFYPGYLYLGGLPEILHTPRRSQPVAVGSEQSVIIGGEQAQLTPSNYGKRSGTTGWWVLGWSPVKTYDIEPPNHTIVDQGDYIRFIPIDESEISKYEGLERTLWENH